MIDLILHIGMQKTGTSAIQYFLHQNRTRLLNDGVFYPSLEQFCDTAFKGVSYHNCVAAGLSRMATTFPRLDGEALQTLRGLIDECRLPVLLSAEDFSRILDLGILREFVSGLNVKIIIYLRDQAAWATSAYNQRNKILFSRADDRLFGPNLLTPADLFGFLKQEHYAPLLRYDLLLERWAAVSENIAVRVFHKSEFAGGDLITDFMSILGVTKIDEYIPAPRVNENIANRWITIVREIAETDGIDTAKRLMRSINANLGEVNLAGDTSILPPKLIKEMRDQYEEHNQRVARVHFGRDELFPSS